MTTIAFGLFDDLKVSDFIYWDNITIDGEFIADRCDDLGVEDTAFYMMCWATEITLVTDSFNINRIDRIGHTWFEFFLAKYVFYEKLDETSKEWVDNLSLESFPAMIQGRTWMESIRLNDLNVDDLIYVQQAIYWINKLAKHQQRIPGMTSLLADVQRLSEVLYKEIVQRNRQIDSDTAIVNVLGWVDSDYCDWLEFGMDN